MRRNTSRICKVCTDEFNPARPWQQYCSRHCQIRDGMKRYRNRKAPAKCHNITWKVSRYPNAITPASTPLLEALEPLSYGFGRPGDRPLQGDDYLLEYYPDGLPKLPPYLDRRRPKQESLAARPTPHSQPWKASRKQGTGWRHWSESSKTNSYTGKGGSRRD
jgi:hypothetical protein